ncbi:hydroxyisourate hydrolase [Nocardia sp. NPDC050412]|uniref:hydroxyisourate hydrolase n=1 Tax=Nocardia sp. NPDC050412 TaxID=3364320 RepID=UPI0037A71005
MPKGWAARCEPSAPRSPAVERVATFYPEVTIAFTVADERHCHVPLLLSPAEPLSKPNSRPRIR